MPAASAGGSSPTTRTGRPTWTRRSSAPTARAGGEGGGGGGRGATPLPHPPPALWPAVPFRPGPTAARPAVARLVVVVVPRPEEPHKPQDQQAHVENAESHHEDPALRTDNSIV